MGRVDRNVGDTYSFGQTADKAWFRRTVTVDGDTYNFLEIMELLKLFNPLHSPLLSVTSFNNNPEEQRVEAWHDGFMQYYISYESIRDGSFRLVENNILLVSQCTALSIGDGDYLEL